MPPRLPALPDLRFSVKQNQITAGRDRGIAAMVVQTVNGQIEIRILVDFSTKIEGVIYTNVGKILRAIGQVIAAIDSPVIPASDHHAPQRAVTNVGHQEAALSRLLL